ncbi:uncharacterized protein TRAVEDRAFT_72398 [Trametes versicolor FP-101664 SS1]|uniref:uncharacterized protein n=1 Tax=Trametes versicolor (strain FP-101664) TaxID=717944 RepID=UPI0004622F68|nr:uncharacterized protein TRAVEDRAFT_72398 [Trametes versicolor FP-101664 SS1]EIW57245.1 hypothetical protein TRAVEDRAFT_72398 [Trametes versicolor FP-101664 SS1]
MGDGQALGLVYLPVELLYDIYTLALSPALPLTCRHLHAVFKSAPLTLHAQYLIRSYHESAKNSASARAVGLVSKILRYPICTREVLEAVFRSPECPHIPPSKDEDRGHTVLPRHIFRNLAPRDAPGQRQWTEFDEPLPFLEFLYTDPRIPLPATNSYEGYALTRAVYAGFTPLVRFLLAHDAVPACKGDLAVTVAIRRKSLPLVRMLIERDGSAPGPTFGILAGEPRGESRKRRRSAKDEDGGGKDSGRRSKKMRMEAGNKRRKLGDRLSATPDMLKTAIKCDARDIAEYLMKEKGVVPDMQTVLMMGR